MKVEITFEKTFRVSDEFDITEEELNGLRSGDIPDRIYSRLEETVLSGDTEYEYAVDDEHGKNIISWL